MKVKIILLVALLISFLGYIEIGYNTSRNDFVKLTSLFCILFIFYFLFVKFWNEDKYFNIFLGGALLFRISLLFMIPNLSDDYFRFVWDGKLLAHGINPYLVLPDQFIQRQSIADSGISMDLFKGLNSPAYYTVYPPVCQMVFAFSARLFPDNIFGSIVVMRIFIILAETGSIIVLIKLFKLLSLPRKNILLFTLNPLVVIELTGNLHFEGLMIFFFLLALYVLMLSRYHLSAIFFALSIGVKLIPFIFLPLIIKYLGWRKGILYSLVTFFIVGILFLPFINNQLIHNLFSSINLYFQRFEFNGSIYYLLRAAGYFFTNHNIISIAGLSLAVISTSIILFAAYFFRFPNFPALFTGFLLTLTGYYFFSTTVHPWYICFVMLLSVFIKYRYAIIWSMIIPLTYITYMTDPYKENLMVVAFEYIVVYIIFLIEVSTVSISAIKTKLMLK